MSRLKKASKVLTKGRQKISGLEAIAPNLDLGNGLTLASYDKLITEAEKLLSVYNESLAETDGIGAKFILKENEVRTMSVRMLKAVLAKFGPDSVEYEQAGGVPTHKKKHPKRKPDKGS